MTIIEFYDKASIENIVSALLCEPQQVILVGDKRKQLEHAKDLYKDILEKNNIKTELSFRSVNKNNLQDIVAVLSQIAEDYENCVFDLTGGEDLYLVAVGIVMARYEGRIQCHRFNLKNSILIDCDADGQTCRVKDFNITVEENIHIYGGRIVESGEADFYTYEWRMDEEFKRDVEALWRICRKNARLWNAQMGTLGTIDKVYGSIDSLEINVSKEVASNTLKYMQEKFTLVPWLMSELEKCNAIHDLNLVEDNISFYFKNEQIKRCLTTSGQVLELMIAYKLQQLLTNDGERLYHDIKVGVVIDWDGCDEKDKIRTVNEIDVIAMKGTTPIFISCKNGDFDMEELYKLNTVAERFGNKYAKKVLVTTELDKLGQKADYIYARAMDMGIRIVKNVDEMMDAELERVLKSLWSN